ncbi:melanoma-associated antigen B5-like [Molossus molossus]|uniref:melanoma-associated antigen B5-like n=1 Tax=Molossus molossus TaxID=27622 RepID=UPI001747BE75|nr:melanoma-associated antigen B5-like [Molossus molossus]
MPRRHRSKRHNNQKPQRAQDEVQSRWIFEAAATVGEEPPSSSSPVLEDNPESSSATEATSTAQESWRVPPIYIPSSVAFPTSSEDGQDEDYSWSHEGLSPENSCCDPLTVQVTVLEKFLLYKYRVKQPILWEDMLNIVNERYHRYFAEILKKASESIEVLFGADLKEVDSTRHSYDLVSKLKLPNNGRVRPGRGLPKTGLLMNILGVIFLNGNRASEEEIWEFLNAMRLFPGKKHYIYGEPRKLITKDLVKLKYLEYRQVPGSDPPCYEFLWGPKAYVETNKMEILTFWAKVNDPLPRAFTSQYEEALREKEERAPARAPVKAFTGTRDRNYSMATSTRVSTPSSL